MAGVYWDLGEPERLERRPIEMTRDAVIARAHAYFDDVDGYWADLARRRHSNRMPEAGTITRALSIPGRGNAPVLRGHRVYLPGL